MRDRACTRGEPRAAEPCADGIGTDADGDSDGDPAACIRTHGKWTHGNWTHRNWTHGGWTHGQRTTCARGICERACAR